VISAAPERRSPELTQKLQMKAFKESTARKVRDLRCPVHGRSPRLRFAGATLRDVTIQMSSCCEQLIGLANHKIAQL
jgi:hypothetical protein